MSVMTSSSFIGSVTALLVLEDLQILLIGTGSYVEMYHLSGFKLLQRFNLFDKTTHTIQGFCRKETSTSQIIVNGGKTVEVISVQENTLKIVQSIYLSDWIMAVIWRKESIWAVTAHNDLIDCQTLKVIQCQDEKCILYSACLVNDTHEIIVIGGTVFRQVLVWGSNSGQVYHRLSGHDGVIFALQYDPDLQMLCSTSDDRTLRLWKVDFDGKSQSWSKAKVFASHVLGSSVHVSRVFRCLFLPSQDMLVSGGEDSVLAFWSISSGNFLGKKTSKSGGSIWSLCRYGESQVISGSANGTVKLMECPTKQNPVNQIDLNDLITSQDCPRIVKFLDSSQALVLTLKGCLLSVKMTESFEKKLIFQDHDLASYALMEVTPAFIYFATLHGKIKWLSDNQLKEQRISDGKIFALTFLANSQRILACVQDGIVQILKHQNDGIQKIGQVVLPSVTKDCQRWFASVAEMKDNFLLVGDRCGNLHVFDTTRNNNLVHSVKAHNRQGVGFVTPVSEESFRTGGRDGKINTYVLGHDGQPKLTCVQHLKIPWLERLGDEQILCGFHSTRFVVYSLHHDWIIASIECGGGHRSWDFDGQHLFFVKDKELVMHIFSTNFQDLVCRNLSLGVSEHTMKT